MFPPRAAVATTWHFEAGTASPRALPNRECLLVPAPERGPQQRELLLSFKLHTSSSANASARAGGEPLPTPSSTRARITLAPNRYYKSPPAHLLRQWGLPPATPGFVRSALLSTPGGLPSEQGWWRASPPADTFPAEPPGGRKGWLQRKLGALARLTLSRVHGFGRPQGTVAAPSCVGSADCQILAVSLLPGAGVGCGRDMRASGAGDLRRRVLCTTASALRGRCCAAVQCLRHPWCCSPGAALPCLSHLPLPACRASTGSFACGGSSSALMSGSGWRRCGSQSGATTLLPRKVR